MIYLRAGLLFSLLVIHLAGGAFLFRRFFPKESPWLGFLIPAFAIAIVCNFIEHGVALTGLHWLMAATMIGSVWLMVFASKDQWLDLWKPMLVFLLAMTIPFALRVLKPDIGQIRDGPLDLFLISSFCSGGTLPPDSGWMPGFKVEHYYDFAHYAASVMTRIFGLDVGTGYNLAGILLSGLILFTSGAIAYRLAGQRLWVALLAVMMTATAMDGSTAYLWLFSPNLKEPDDATNFFNHAGDAGAGAFDSLIPHGTDYQATHELLPVGYWSWAGSFHSVAAGQLLMLFSVLCLIEMFSSPRTNWPWIGSLWAVLLMVVCSAWGVTELVLFALIGAVWCLRSKIYPGDWRVVIGTVVGAVVALTPTLFYFLQTHATAGSVPALNHTPWQEFAVQWWPAFIPWALLFFWWNKTHPAVRILQIVLPVMFLTVEYWNVGARLDMTGKCWGYIYGAAFAVFVPALLSVRSWTLRGVMAAFVVMTGISACFWVDYYHRSVNWDDVAQITGQGDMRSDAFKGRLYNELSTVSHKIVVVGKSASNYGENPLLANLTNNKAYIAWCSHGGTVLHPESYDTSANPDDEANNIYSGKMSDPLDFLREKDISALVIWPDDNDDPAVVATLKQKLAPDYNYVDCRGFHPDASAPQCGVFMYRGASIDHQVAQR